MYDGILDSISEHNVSTSLDQRSILPLSLQYEFSWPMRSNRRSASHIGAGDGGVVGKTITPPKAVGLLNGFARRVIIGEVDLE